MWSIDAKYVKHSSPCAARHASREWTTSARTRAYAYAYGITTRLDDDDAQYRLLAYGNKQASADQARSVR